MLFDIHSFIFLVPLNGCAQSLGYIADRNEGCAVYDGRCTHAARKGFVYGYAGDGGTCVPNDTYHSENVIPVNYHTEGFCDNAQRNHCTLLADEGRGRGLFFDAVVEVGGASDGEVE